MEVLVCSRNPAASCGELHNHLIGLMSKDDSINDDSKQKNMSGDSRKQAVRDLIEQPLSGPFPNELINFSGSS